ncbi:hypothetical protein SDC9_30534 [bioreactor metagenome]|uniref:Uncharacterized protein n=1 Tax=bioreactor metagenome TaxID=1076179 RepID=A0A644UZQ0_9ZZZZ|nr:baseplate J/gp47 family protein [Methanobrevibacter sp.]MEA4957533.1 baseplate J/gp47 family protein [Methanobrevibacter sp.]
MADEFEAITEQIISKEDIRDTKINAFKDRYEEGKCPINDFEEGRVARTIVDSDTEDSYEVRYLIDNFARMDFPQFAVRGFLDKCGERVKCPRKPPNNSKGQLKFFFEDEQSKDYDILIPMTTMISTDDEESFEVETIIDATLPAGQSEILVPAESIEDGSEYNIPAGKLTILNTEIDDLEVTNPEAFTGGEDAEDDESYRERILNSGEGLLEGSEPWFKAMAEQYPGVHDAAVFIKEEGHYNIEIVINSFEKPTPDTLIDDLMNFFYQDDMKKARLNPLIKKAENVSVDISCVLDIDSNFDTVTVINNVKNDITSYIYGGTTSKGVKLKGSYIKEELLRVQLYSIISNVNGIINYDLNLPLEDVIIGPDEVIILGNLEVTSR